MGPLFLLALLGMSLLIPVFTSNEDDIAATDAEAPPEPATPPEQEPSPDAPDAPTAPDTPDTAQEDPAPTGSDTVTEQDGIITGSRGDDEIFASERSPVVRGADGDDRLWSFIDGVVADLDGGAGDDALETSALVGFPELADGSQTLTGGQDTDRFVVNLNITPLATAGTELPLVTITDFARGSEELTFRLNTFGERFALDELTQDIAPDDSFTDFNFSFSDTQNEVDNIVATVRLAGIAGLNGEEFTVDDGRVLVEGTDGNDTLRTTGFNLGRTGIDTLSGGAGDDLLVQEPTDDAGRTVLLGGAGNDTLVASEVEFSNPTTLDGGAGDDLLISEPFQSGVGDLVVTGEGADTVAISTVFSSIAGSDNFGTVATVTDFDLDEDVILIDTAAIGGTDTGATFDQEITLTDDVANMRTIITYVVTNTANSDQVSGAIRLQGLTGLSEDDITLTIANLRDTFTNDEG